MSHCQTHVAFRTYNPLFVTQIVDYAQSGTIYVWDCDNAGVLVKAATEHGARRDKELHASTAHLPARSLNSITHSASDFHFAACSHHEILPLIEGLPRSVLETCLQRSDSKLLCRDVFTSCMTSPVLMALRFYYLGDTLRLNSAMASATPDVTLMNLLNIPGSLHDRETVRCMRACRRKKSS